MESDIRPRYFFGDNLTGKVRAAKEQTFDCILECLEKPARLKITYAAYHALAKDKQHDAKQVPYFVAATFKESPSKRSRENALSCNLLFLDLDECPNGTCPAAPFVDNPNLLAERLKPFGFAAYTTASHTPDKPRLRIMVNAEEIPLEYYPQAINTIAEKIGLSTVTTESKVAVQPMFMPTLFADQLESYSILGVPVLIKRQGKAFRVENLELSDYKPSKYSADNESDECSDISYLRSIDEEITLEIVEEALGNIDPDCRYDDWINTCAALKHQFSPKQDELAYKLFDRWSASGKKYSGAEETRKKWNSFKPSVNDRRPITIGTLLKQARDSGWTNNSVQVTEWQIKEYIWKTAPNDTGNAEVFANAFKDRLRYCHTIREWFIWNGVHWRPNQTQIVSRLAQELSKQALRDASHIQDEHARKAASVRALSMGNASKIEAMLKLAQTAPSLSVSLRDLDNDPAIVGVQNGVLNLETRTFIRAARLPYVTKKLGCPYDPAAQCPTWERFLLEVMDGDLALVRFLQASIGYSLTGHTTEHIFWFLWGSGANGKSTLMEILQALAGEYAARTSDSLLALSPNGREPLFELAELPGQRLLLGSEIAENSRLNEKLVKDLTGGDTMRARGLYQQGFSFKPVCKLWMFGNHRPAIGGTDHGIWRRTRMIPFKVQFSGNKMDKTLGAKLRVELSGILNWALDGVLDWSVSGLPNPEAVSKAVEDYRHDEDWLGDFIAECLIPGKTPVSKRAVFETYLRWSERNGHRNPMTTKKLSRRLKDRGFVEKPEKYWQAHSLLERGRDDVCDEDTAISIDDLF